MTHEECVEALLNDVVAKLSAIEELLEVLINENQQGKTAE